MKSLLNALIIPVLLVACGPKPNTAETPVINTAPNTIQVMVLGTYHMGNPGQDVANMEADNVLTPTRQIELANISEALATFKPTLIAVEGISKAPSYIDVGYAKFKPEELLTIADERVQISYRLAHRLRLKQVYGIDEQPSEDEPDYFPFGKVMEHAQSSEQGDIIEADIANIQKLVKDFGDTQKHRTVGELLMDLHEMSDQTAGFYYNMFKYDRGEAQPGAELQAYWFMRNAKIFGKLHQVAKPGDRVLVVYGSGHTHWLTHFANHTPGFTSVDPVPYLEKVK